MNEEIANQTENPLRVYKPRSSYKVDTGEKDEKGKPIYKDTYDPNARNAYEDYVKKGDKYYDPRNGGAYMFGYPSAQDLVYNTLIDDTIDPDRGLLGYDENTPLPKKLGDNKETYEFLMNSPFMQRYMNYFDDATAAEFRKEHEGIEDKEGYVQRFIDFAKGALDDEVEEAIESNPEVAEQVTESISGEDSPIETEAEQLNDSNPNNDEVKDEAIEQTSTEEKQEIINELDIGNQISSSEDTPEKQEALKEFQEAPKEVAAIDGALSTSDPEEAKEILEETFPELTDGEVNLSRKEKAELDAAQALYDNINKAIDEMVSYGNKPRRTKAEREQARQELDDLETRDQIEMNPGNFLPDLYKQIVKADPRDVDNYWEKVDYDDNILNVAYEIKDDPTDWRRFIDWNDHVFKIPFLNWKGKFYEPKTFGYDKPQINADAIPGTDNSIELGDSGHTVAGGSISNPSFSGGSSGGSVSSGSVVSPTQQNKQRATPGRSFGGGHVNLVGSGSNPVATAAHVGGSTTSGAVVRSSDPNMSKGGHLAESRTQLPGGWANNQVPGGELDIAAGEDYQDRDAMTEKGSLLSAKLEMMLQEDAQTWDGDNSGDKYAPYIFFISGDQFYYQKGREKHAVKNADDATVNELINILVSNN